MSWLGAIFGLGVATKVHEKIDQDHDDSFIEDAFEVGVASTVGKIAGDILDDVLDTSEEEDEGYDW